MSDLLSALLVPKSSQESFHSASSQPTIPPSPTAHPSTQHTTLPTAHNGAPIHLYDVHTFLSSTATATAPSPTTSSSSSSTTATNRPPGAPLVPVPLGTPHSAASVSRLHELCQEKGLSPVFAIEEDPARAQWFRGSLSVGAAAATLVLDASQPTKKEARQLLAAQGCELVRGMPARVRRRDDAAAGGPAGENWVGKLL
ncbi:hypothetical protein MMC11_008708, partial [Xylographa trunciseda]|nr:hypothetical protein [Xylographa trunciseda]